MNKPPLPRPVASVTPASRASAPSTVPLEQGWLARAWARHPLVVMRRHRSRLTFFRGLHDMLRAGLPLSTAFVELSRGAERDPFRRAVVQVGQAVSSGSGLAEAMRQHSRWFEPQAVELLGAAEVTGTLESGLARLLEQMEEAQRMRWRVVMRCVYPGYLLAAFVFAGSLLESALWLMKGGSMESLLAVFAALVGRKGMLLACAALALFLAPLVLAAPVLAPHWERVRMSLPVLGRIHRELQASRFSLVLGAALGAGLEVGQGLQMALEATGSVLLRARLPLVLHRIRSGASLTDVVTWLRLFDGGSLQQVSTGERTGDLEPVFTRLSREHAERAMRQVSGLVFALVLVLSAVLIAMNLGKVVQLQGGYQQRLEELLAP